MRQDGGRRALVASNLTGDQTVPGLAPAAKKSPGAQRQAKGESDEITVLLGSDGGAGMRLVGLLGYERDCGLNVRFSGVILRN